MVLNLKSSDQNFAGTIELVHIALFQLCVKAGILRGLIIYYKDSLKQ